jgi:hypothetical protein
MAFRARLSLTWLETRENPSVPGADPYAGNEIPSTDPVPPPPSTDPVLLAEAAVIAGVTIPPETPPAPPPDTTYLLYQLP